jgi:hypothetical protein
MIFYLLSRAKVLRHFVHTRIFLLPIFLGCKFMFCLLSVFILECDLLAPLVDPLLQISHLFDIHLKKRLSKTPYTKINYINQTNTNPKKHQALSSSKIFAGLERTDQNKIFIFLSPEKSPLIDQGGRKLMIVRQLGDREWVI